MAEVQIDNMRIRHEMILDWLIMNPDKTQGECAQYFNVTQPWLSVIINSDVFQARWKERRMLMDHRTAGLSEAKLRGVVNRGIERLEKMVNTVEDPRFVLDTTDKLLGRLGYGPKTAAAVQVNSQTNVYAVNKDVLAAARAQIGEAGRVIAEAKALVQAEGEELNTAARLVQADAQLARADEHEETLPQPLELEAEPFPAAPVFHGLKVPKL